MPVQGPPWTEFLSCHVCSSMFDDKLHRPISLGCGHTICKTCLSKLETGRCPFDQSSITSNVDELPVNYALLQLVGAAASDKGDGNESNTVEQPECLEACNKCIADLAAYLKTDTPNPKSENLKEGGDHHPSVGSSLGNLASNNILSRPIQKKLVSLLNCQLLEEEGRARAMRSARSLGERAVAELILQHQNPHQLSINLWAAVRARGCQFLGPAMQEEVLRLILLVLEDASALSRKVLVLFVVQQLEDSYPQASKTAIGHVVQLLYRASCFKVTKREEESSLMQLKEEFRTYDALRREHDSQVVQIAMEAALRISPEQWSSLLYGDTSHKSHMQSIIDKLQSPQSFSQSISELAVALQRTGDPSDLAQLTPHLEYLASIDPCQDAPVTSFENLEAALKALQQVMKCLVEFYTNHGQKKTDMLPLQNARYKTSMCRDQTEQGACPRGISCTFAHTQEELEKYRAKSKKLGIKHAGLLPTVNSLSPKERAELDEVNRLTSQKLATFSKHTEGDIPGTPYQGDNIKRNLPLCRVTNSGIPCANVTPSIVAPAHYRKANLVAGPAVKETYYRPHMTQGALCMSPYETAPVEGNRMVVPPYLSSAIPRPGLPYPPVHYTDDGRLFHPAAPSMSGPPQMPRHWTPPHCDTSDNMYKNIQAYPPSRHSHQPPSNQPFHHRPPSQHPHRYHGYISNQPSHDYQDYLPPEHHIPEGHNNQSRQSLRDLQSRRNRIIVQIQNRGSLETRPLGIKTQPRASQDHRKRGGEEKKVDSSSDLETSVGDTYVAARTMFSLATSGHLPEANPDPFKLCQPWESSLKSSVDWSVDDMVIPPSLDENNSPPTFSWMEDEDQPDLDPAVPRSFIPFDPPLVSKFGPISRVARSKLKNTDPVQVTAHQTVKRMTPVAALRAADCPMPAPAPVPSRFNPWELPPPTYLPSPVSTRCAGDQVLSPMWRAGEDSQFMIQSDPTRLSHQQLKKEFLRLESKALTARSQGESLDYELQAVDIQIAMQTLPISMPRCQSFETKRNPPKCIRASDPVLTMDEQKRLHDLTVNYGGSDDNCSQQQEQILAQLLKLKNLGQPS